jgi:hypothetical protein
MVLNGRVVRCSWRAASVPPAARLAGNYLLGFPQSVIVT